MPAPGTTRLLNFTPKATPVGADVLYGGNSANAFNEIEVTCASVINIYPALSSIGQLTTSTNQMLYTTGSNSYATTPITAFTLTLLDDANAAAARSTLGAAASGANGDITSLTACTSISNIANIITPNSSTLTIKTPTGANGVNAFTRVSGWDAINSQLNPLVEFNASPDGSTAPFINFYGIASDNQAPTIDGANIYYQGCGGAGFPVNVGDGGTGLSSIENNATLVSNSSGEALWSTAISLNDAVTQLNFTGGDDDIDVVFNVQNQGSGDANAFISSIAGGAGNGGLNLQCGGSGWSFLYRTNNNNIELRSSPNGGGTAIAVFDPTATVYTMKGVTQAVSNSGLSVSHIVSNTSNTASSTALVQTVVAGGTASDAMFQATVTGGSTWTWGVDNSDSDAFALAASSALGTTNVVRAGTTGALNYPLQPCFLGTLSNVVNSATGNGVSVTLGTTGSVAFTEVYDQGSCFNTNGTFTAPVTGKYFLKVNVGITNMTIGTGFTLSIITTGRTLTKTVNFAALAGTYGIDLSDHFSMNATDTAYVTIVGNGEESNTQTIQNGTYTTFSGILQA